MRLFRSFVLATACLASGVAVAQDYPAKPIRMIIPAAPGGGVDLGGRILATRLSATLGKPVVPENRAGAGTMIASEMLAQSAPDGYTILLVSSSHAVNAAVRKSLRYDPLGDFAAVSQIGSTPDLLVVNPQSGIRSVADLVAAAKKAPGKMTFGSSGPGTLSQLEPELFKKAAHIDMLHVPYKGGVPAVTALMGNEIDTLFLGTVALAPLVKTGKLRPIAVTGKTRSPMFPDVPTLAESGFPDWDTGTWYGVLVPAKTPPAIVATLNKHINDAIRQPDIRDKLAATGIEPKATTADQFSSLMKTDIARWQKVVEKMPQLKINE